MVVDDGRYGKTPLEALEEHELRAILNAPEVNNPTWSPVIERPGCYPVRWTQRYSHALTVEVLDDDGDVILDMDVKWDGCINWQTTPEVCFHFCGPENAAQLAMTFDLAWELTASNLPTADADSFARKGAAR